MSLGGLIPIGGGGGGGAKKANDLTSGLISISAPKGGGGGGGGDLDMSDFDVDDLLSDTGGKLTSKSAASPTLKDGGSSSSKKKSTSGKTKDKASSSSAKSKKKSKSKKPSVFDDSADNDGSDGASKDYGGSSSKSKAKSGKWSFDDDSTEFDGVPVKKKGSLDAEFAKMLGLDDELGASGAESSAGATRPDNVDESGAQVARFSTRDDEGNDDLFGKADNESAISSFSYEPRVRDSQGRDKPVTSRIADGADSGGGAKRANDPFATSRHDDGVSGGAESKADDDTIGGLSASFFQSEPTGAQQGGDDDPFGNASLSFLSSTSERRGGRGGRRGGGSSAPVADDPFASAGSGRHGGGGSDVVFGAKDEPEKKASALDALFSGARAKTEKERKEKVGGSSEQGQPGNSVDNRKAPGSSDLFSELFPSEPSSSSRRAAVGKAPVEASTIGARDDLLAELFDSEPLGPRYNKSVTVEERSPEPVKPLPSSPPTLDTGLRNARDDLLAELMPPPETSKPQPRRRAGDQAAGGDVKPGKQQDDLLAELFPSPSTTEKQKSDARGSFRDDSASRASVHSTRDADQGLASHEPTTNAGSKTPKPSTERKTAGLDDISSARDSLLMGLLPASPPKKPVERRRRSGTPSTLPVKELVPTTATGDANKDTTRRPSMSPQRSPARTDEPSPTWRNASVPTAGSSSSPEPPASPGRAKTLASPSASSIKEADFEQSKESLLDELLAPSKSPPHSPVNSGAHRRNSYSQSFDDDDEPTRAVDDEPTRAVDDSARPRRRSSTSAVSSPARSPDNKPLSGHHESPPRDRQEPPRDERGRESVIGSTASKIAPVNDSLVRNRDNINNALRADELETAKAALVAAHSAELAQLNTVLLSLTQQLHDAQRELQTAAVENAQATLVAQETRQHSARLELELSQARQELAALRAQHALCESQSVRFETERMGFESHRQRLEEQTRQLMVALGQEKEAHEATQLALSSLRATHEQDARLQQQRESHQMRALTHQLQTSLASLSMLQAQVADEDATAREVETASRLRVIASLETSARTSAKQSEQECVRLASLLGTLERTLRQCRHEQLEEKERLRQEQLRLSALAAHWQAQTGALRESTDSHGVALAEGWAAARQDARVVEARLAERRRAVELSEQQLFDERARVAAFHEQLLVQQARETQDTQRERAQLDAQWRELRLEREDLAAVIAAHEPEFRFLQEQQRTLSDERDGLADHAKQLAAAAESVEALSRELLAREDAVARAQEELERGRLAVGAAQQSVVGERRQLDERELRLRGQLQQVDKARQRLHCQRQEHLVATSRVGSGSSSSLGLDVGSSQHPLAAHDLEQAKRRLLEHTHYMGASGLRPSSTVTAAVNNNRKWRSTTTSGAERSGHTNVPSTSRHSDNQASKEHSGWASRQSPPAPPSPLVVASDPPGLTPAFRRLVEDNWTQQHERRGAVGTSAADAALRKERVWLSCLGLDSRTAATPLTPEDEDAVRAGTHHLQAQQRQHSRFDKPIMRSSSTTTATSALDTAADVISAPTSATPSASALLRSFAAVDEAQKTNQVPSSRHLPTPPPAAQSVPLDL